MEKPDLNRVWETFIKIGLPNEVSFERVTPMIRTIIYPLISNLEQNKIINWYCFLRHARGSGVPTTEDDDNHYFHIRVALREGVKPKDFLKLLPEYCVMTRKVERSWVEQIAVTKTITFDTSLLKCEEIEEVWRIIGEQSEWLMKLLDMFKEDVDIPSHHIGIFWHYYANMTCLGVM